MTIGTTVAAVGTVIKKIAGYDADNVKENDYRPLSLGKARVVVLRRGANSQREELSLGTPVTILNRWEVIAELYIKFGSEISTQASDLDTETDKILDEISKWPKLDAAPGIIYAIAGPVEEPEPWVLGSHRFWRQKIRVEAHEIETITRSE